jgi:hypothetical protein
VMATCARPRQRCSGMDKVAPGHRRWGPYSNRGEHQKEEVRAALQVQAIGKPSTLRALPPNTDAATLKDQRRGKAKIG